MLIRRAATQDLALLGDLSVRTFREAFETFYKESDFTAFLEEAFHLEKLGRELADPACTFLFAELDGETIGYALVRQGPPEFCVKGPDPIELVRIYTLQNAVGKGVGPALMAACIEVAKACDARTLWLGVWENNPRALAFYARHGFVDVGFHHFSVGSQLDVDRILVKDLSQP
jgi:ribosomal protein S18 acetylase RimI-like enzyme